MRLPAPRLRPPGPPSTSAAKLAVPAALVALALAGAWCAYAWLSPVATIAYDAPANLPARIAIERPAQSMDQRTAHLDTLARVNRFDDDLAFWSTATSEDVADNRSRDTPPALPEPIDTLINDALAQHDAEEITLTAEEDIPDDVKAARKNLELKGLYLDPRGTPAAMIGYVNRQRGSTIARRPGDHFTDPSHDASPWVVGRVQLERHRVVLVRSGATIAIDLFTDGERPATTARAEPAYTPGGNTPRVQSRSRDEIVRDLREAGVPEGDILAALRLMEVPTNDLDLAPPTVVDLTNAKPEVSEEQIDEATGSAPEGMNEIMRMMAEMQREAEARRKEREN